MDERHVSGAVLGACAVTAAIPPVSKLALLEVSSLRARLRQLVELLERPWQWN
jgi:hypothetical protein